jgi:hypothetical protein
VPDEPEADGVVRRGLDVELHRLSAVQIKATPLHITLHTLWV